MTKIIGITGYKYSGKDTLADFLCTKYGYKKVAFANLLKELCGLLFGLNYEQMYGNQKETPINKWWNLSAREILQFVGTDVVRNNMDKLHHDIGQKFWITSTLRNLKQNGNKSLTSNDPTKNVIKLLFNISDDDYLNNICVEDWYNINAQYIYKFIYDLFLEHMPKLHDNFVDFWSKCENNMNIFQENNNNDDKKKYENNENKYVFSDVRFPNECNAIKEINGVVIRITRNSNIIDNHESEKYISTLEINYELDNNSTKNDLYTKIENLLPQIDIPHV